MAQKGNKASGNGRSSSPARGASQAIRKNVSASRVAHPSGPAKRTVHTGKRGSEQGRQRGDALTDPSPMSMGAGIAGSIIQGGS